MLFGTGWGLFVHLKTAEMMSAAKGVLTAMTIVRQQTKVQGRITVDHSQVDICVEAAAANLCKLLPPSSAQTMTVFAQGGFRILQLTTGLCIIRSIPCFLQEDRKQRCTL